MQSVHIAEYLLCNMILQENECDLLQLQGQAEKALLISIIESSKCVNITDAILISLLMQLMLSVCSL